MPLIQVKTNVPISREAEVQLKSALGKAITVIPTKTESGLMIQFEPQAHLWFGGSDAPALIAVVSVFRASSNEAYQAFTAEACRIFTQYLAVPGDRIYIKFDETLHWGRNGSNFSPD